MRYSLDMEAEREFMRYKVLILVVMDALFIALEAKVNGSKAAPS